MIDIDLSGSVVNDADAFSSCEFDEGKDATDDSFSFASEDDVEGVNIRVHVDESDDGSSFSSYNEDYEVKGDVEDQPEEETPKRFSFEDDKSSSTSSLYIQPKRSDYAARRCSNVDIMTQRLMIHAEDYRNNPNRVSRKSRCRSLCLWGGAIFALGALVAISFMVVILHKHNHSMQTGSEPSTTPNVAVDLSIFDALENIPERPNAQDTENMVKVPFANQHNLRYDGLLFVKDSVNTLPSTNQVPMKDHVFDAYAKTLDPITELHFSPGESNTTKHIVLTTTQPDLQLNSLIEQNPTRDHVSDPGVVLSIGLEANGELWLPNSTGKNILEFETNLGDNHKHHHYSHALMKRIYGPGDRFVLSISHDVITLFRNDYHELVGMWQNPFKDVTKRTFTNPLSGSSSLQHQSIHGPLYAQIWFKENKSSMMINAWHK